MKQLSMLILMALPAQIVHGQNAVLATLPSNMQRFVVEADPTLAFRTDNVPGGRWDLDAGVMRAVFRLPPTGEVAATPEGTARAWMDAEADRFGWSSSDEFELERTIEGRYSAHLSFRQVFRGVKVHNRIVKVNLSADGYPTMVFSGYAPHLREFANFAPAPAIGAGEAENLAKRAVSDGPFRATPAELVVYPAEVPRLAWRVVTWPEGVPLSWEVLLDARTGEVIYLLQLLLHENMFQEFPKPAAEPHQEPTHTPVRLVDGTGLVFDPDPLTTAGVEYGAPYVDSDDADVPELNAERLEVDLLGITESDDGLYRLIGPYVEITGTSSLGGYSWTPPAVTDPDNFLYGRANQAFEAVNVYYHVDKSQRYLQSLDIGHEVQEGPLLAHPHGLGPAHNAFYDINLNGIVFGDGGIDLAEDAQVIWHEYGHALLHEVAPGVLYSAEGRSIHEGFGDYWAISYTRSLIEDGTVPERDWRKVGTWESNETWAGRYLDHDGVYPEDTHCDTGWGGLCNVYDDGRFWATSMMELWSELGRATLDRLILASHAYYASPASMPNTAEALVQADKDLNGGGNLGTIFSILVDRGLLDAADAPLPATITHEPLGWVETPGEVVVFRVEVDAPGHSVAEVWLHWRPDAEAFAPVSLEEEGGGFYTASVGLPEDASVVAYWFEASTDAGVDSRLPEDAPDFVFWFPVGSAPSLAHEPPVAFPGETATLQVDAVAGSAPLRGVAVYYAFDGGVTETADLEAEGGDAWAAAIPLGDDAFRISYWFEAEAENNLTARLPIDAPETEFEVPLGAAPALSHDTLGWQPEPGADVAFSVDVESAGTDIFEVRLHWRTGTGAFAAVGLSPNVDGAFGMSLTLPADAYDIAYWFEATTVNGLSSRLPALAPSVVFQFPVGPAPAISHEEVGPVSNADDPVSFVAEIAAPHAPLAETELLHRINGSDWTSSAMAAENDSLYAVTVTLSDEAYKVDYWFRAELSNGLEAKLPEGAPDSVFSFVVGGVPAIAHEPLGWEQDRNASVAFTAEVDGNGAEVRSVTLRYAYDQGAWDSLAFEPSGGSYGATLGLPGDAVEVDYYVEAVSENGFTTRLPESAPDNTFRFPVGPAPAISHEELGPVPDVDDPIHFVAEIKAPHAPVAETELFHRINGGEWIPSAMAAENDSLYAVAVTLSDDADQVDYWFKAELTNGLSARRPEGAPDSLFSFVVSGAPAIAHEPLGWEPDPDASLEFTAEVDGNGAEIASVTLHYAYDQGARDSLAFEPSGGSYGATLDLPGDAVEVDYYVEAVSENGFTTRLPESAPDSTFRFPVGPAPSIVHQPQAWVPTFGAPLTLSAAITAPHAPVAEALLHYRKEGSAYNVLPMVQNADNEWEATITLDAVSIEYWLQAKATNALEARAPESAPDEVHSFPVGAKPSLAHEKLRRVEAVGATVGFSIDVTSPDVPVAEVLLTYRLNGGLWQDKALAPKAGIAYGASVVLPDDAELVEYRFQATATNGLTARLPEEGHAFSFPVGTDMLAPDVTHDPILLIAVKDWPPGVSAAATDDYGIASVWVEYAVTGENGATIKEGSIPLDPDGNRYGGVFPAVELPERSTVAYRVLARDIAQDPNVGGLPPEGEAPFTFLATVEGEAVAYDFESPDSLMATGSWERGAPAYGLTVAHSGRSVWGTALDGAVAASASVSHLRLPAVLLPSDHGALLEFWHWYDFEHAGIAGPGPSASGTIYDGGNVKASVDGGLTWTLLTPERGYTGRIATGSDNPLEGDPAFGGYGFGWRRVRAKLPAERDILVRFDMGTNRGNSHESRFHAGWMIDDVRVLTAPATDDQPPEVLRAPAAVLESAADEDLRPIIVSARDNIGVESVTADWEHTSDIHSRMGTLRLDMAASDASTFTGTIPTAGPPASGDRIAYTLRVQDFGGNETVLPESGDPFAIEVRLRRSVGALRGATLTGLWASDGDGYAARGMDGHTLSSVVLQPQYLASNTDQIVLELAHAFDLGAGTGGNLKLSSDGGAKWTVLTPLEGYGATLDTQNAHPMRGEPVFAGRGTDSTVATFDLGTYRAGQVRLRLDLGAERVLSPAEFWAVSELALIASTSENALEVPRELSLHANFPDPFSESTTIGFTLPDAARVRIEAYDILGRRVRVLVDRDFEAGTHTLVMPGSGLAPGVYLARMTVGTTQLVERMIFVR